MHVCVCVFVRALTCGVVCGVSMRMFILFASKKERHRWLVAFVCVYIYVYIYIDIQIYVHIFVYIYTNMYVIWCFDINEFREFREFREFLYM